MAISSHAVEAIPARSFGGAVEMTHQIQSEAQSVADRRSELANLLPLTGEISDPSLRDKVLTVWEQLWSRSDWDSPDHCPFLTNLPVGSKYSLIKHTNSVTKNALRMAETLEEDFGIQVNRDRLLAICFLHDASKLVEYTAVDGFGKRSETGQTFPHAMLAGVVADEVGIDRLIVKTIIVHPFHPPHTFVRPTCIEHLLEHWADLGTADPIMLLENIPTHLENKRFFDALSI
jgi:7,8-dihydroneopterin 2',3'-cyclic phosphate phosphodiesterase